MRYLMRIIMTLVMLLLLFAGIGSLIAWPLSYQHSPSLSLVRGEVIQDPDISTYLINAERWDTVGFSWGSLIYLSSGHNLSSPGTSSIHPIGHTYIRLESQLQTTGGPIDIYKGGAQGSMNLFNVIEHNGVILAAHVPAWLIPAVALPISLTWLTLVVRKLINKDIRMQTNLCLHCGYNLTGVESDKCPECGADRPLVTVSSQA